MYNFSDQLRMSLMLKTLASKLYSLYMKIVEICREQKASSDCQGEYYEKNSDIIEPLQKNDIFVQSKME